LPLLSWDILNLLFKRGKKSLHIPTPGICVDPFSHSEIGKETSLKFLLERKFIKVSFPISEGRRGKNSEKEERELYSYARTSQPVKFKKRTTISHWEADFS